MNPIQKIHDFFLQIGIAFYYKGDKIELLNYMEVHIMAYRITDDCVQCGACADACPASAISEGDDKYVINADECLECGACQGECPNDAIVEE